MKARTITGSLLGSLAKLRAPKFKALPAELQVAAQKSRIVRLAQKLFHSQVDPTIDNRKLWSEIGRAIEHCKINDHDFIPYLEAFMFRVESTRKHILEIGSAIGINAKHIMQLRPGQKYTGFDITEKSIAEAERLVPKARFKNRDILHDFKDKKYDAAFAADLFPYLSPEQQIIALLNIHGHLKRNAPVMLRWFSGPVVNFVTKEQKVGADNGIMVSWWEMEATTEYIRAILTMTGFGQLDFRFDELSVYTNTPFERQQAYHTIFAKTN